VSLIEVDRSKQIIELGYVIAQKIASLAGFEAAKTLFEIADALQESKHLSGLLNVDQTTAGQVLLEFDLFTMTTLACSQYAVAHVHVLTQPEGLADSSDMAMEEAGRKVLHEAKRFVAERVRQARQSLSEAGARFWIRFPEDGMWAGAPQF